MGAVFVLGGYDMLIRPDTWWWKGPGWYVNADAWARKIQRQVAAGGEPPERSWVVLVAVGKIAFGVVIAVVVSLRP